MAHPNPYQLDRASIPAMLERARHSRRSRQSFALSLVEHLWGKRSTAERAERFFEEAAELLQAEGVPAGRAFRIVGAVYRKPSGKPAQEAGGVGFTLLSYCAAKGIEADAAEMAEIERVSAKDPAEMMARHEAKRASGLVADDPTTRAEELATFGILAEIAGERASQRARGFGAAHDDATEPGNLSRAALSYTAISILALRGKVTPANLRHGVSPLDLLGARHLSWPWERRWWKPGPVRRMLIKALALIVAEVETYDRRPPAERMAEPAPPPLPKPTRRPPPPARMKPRPAAGPARLHPDLSPAQVQEIVRGTPSAKASRPEPRTGDTADMVERIGEPA